MNHDIDVLLENKALKDEFAIRNLDLTDVFDPTPDDLQRENRFLSHLFRMGAKISRMRRPRINGKRGLHVPACRTRHFP